MGFFGAQSKAALCQSQHAKLYETTDLPYKPQTVVARKNPCVEACFLWIGRAEFELQQFLVSTPMPVQGRLQPFLRYWTHQCR